MCIYCDKSWYRDQIVYVRDFRRSPIFSAKDLRAFAQLLPSFIPRWSCFNLNSGLISIHNFVEDIFDEFSQDKKVTFESLISILDCSLVFHFLVPLGLFISCFNSVFNSGNRRKNLNKAFQCIPFFGRQSNIKRFDSKRPFDSRAGFPNWDNGFFHFLPVHEFWERICGKLYAFIIRNKLLKRQVNDDAYLGSLKIVLWISFFNTFFVGLQCSGILLTGEVVAGLLWSSHFACNAIKTYRKPC